MFWTQTGMEKLNCMSSNAINNPEKAAEQADEELANVAETIQAAERGRIARKNFLKRKMLQNFKPYKEGLLERS